MYATLIAAAALWGAAAGLLVPRAAYRLAVAPEEAWRARCPAGHPITGPAAGWLGTPRCAPCDSGAHNGGEPDGAPYAPSRLLPAVTALACAALAAATGPRPELAVWLLLVPFAVLLARVDLAVRRLPDVLTLPLAAATAALLGFVALLPGDGGPGGGSWPTSLLGGLALGACYFVLFLVNPKGLGFGDVKLALVLGVALGWYGWGVLFAGAFAGFLLGSVYGSALMLRHRTTRGLTLPFGPFMIAGAFLGLLAAGLATG
ncbi:prepilin peptidase [Streptomyces liangshanensis]|uniref:prepilin peptidase n=1 Tax=Streptomyces liangshanensis TaxID=2717324 RepID=UPI001AAFB0A3|nr:prepilin peptidase [Streptomyces liangshanensis]